MRLAFKLMLIVLTAFFCLEGKQKTHHNKLKVRYHKHKVYHHKQKVRPGRQKVSQGRQKVHQDIQTASQGEQKVHQGIPTVYEGKPKVHIVSYNACLIPGEETYLRYPRIQAEYDVSFFVDLYKYANAFVDSEDLHKVIFIDYCHLPKEPKIPQHKLICCKWEAAKARRYEPYSRVYTFDDDLIDNQKFFKSFYPVLQPMIDDLPPFNERKLFTMMAGNFTPKERRDILDFFATKPLGVFDFYGQTPQPYIGHPMAKGPVEGFSSSRAKLETLKNYRFCICFENTHNVKGYITEKIFDVFAAGSIPIYWGPDNVTDFIPANCFIDYRLFKDNEEMYNYLLSFTESQFEAYLTNIRNYLDSPEAKLFSAEHFEDLLLEALRS